MADILLEYQPSQPVQPKKRPPSVSRVLDDDDEIAMPQVTLFGPSPLSSLSSSGEVGLSTMVNQIWTSEQIGDFVRKLGFLHSEKEGGERIKSFLHLNFVSLQLYLHKYY